MEVANDLTVVSASDLIVEIIRRLLLVIGVMKRYSSRDELDKDRSNLTDQEKEGVTCIECDFVSFPWIFDVLFIQNVNILRI